MWIFCRGTLHKNSFGGVWCGCHIHVFTFSCVMWTINLQISQISQSKLVEGYKTSIWENHHNTCIAFWKKFKNVAKLTSISRIWMPAIKTWQLPPSPPPPHTQMPLACLSVSVQQMCEVLKILWLLVEHVSTFVRVVYTQCKNGCRINILLFKLKSA